MKKSLLLLLIFSFTITVSAQKESKAKDILDKASAAYAKTGDLSIYFTMNIKDAPNKIRESFDGTIDIKAAKFHIDMPENEIWFDGKTQWVLQKAWEEVSISEPTEQEVQTINPGAIFALYKKGCNYKYLGEKIDIKMRKIYEIELIPQNKKENMAKIILQINADNLMPAMIHIYFTNKIENLIYINKFETKTNIPDNIFVFDKKKYSNAEIIDLR